MILLFTSLLAGVITILSPCVLPMLPIIIGKSTQNIKSIITICVSIMITVILATIVLKGAIGLVVTDTEFLRYISGFILILLSLTYIFPLLWAKIETKFHLGSLGNNILSKNKSGSLVSDILIGFALALVFNSCSPTYAIIVSTILPVSFLEGLVYIIAYSLGLGLSLFIAGLFGRSVIDLFKFSLKNNFRRIFGVIILVIGVGIIFGIDKVIESYLLELNLIDIVFLEELLPSE